MTWNFSSVAILILGLCRLFVSTIVKYNLKYIELSMVSDKKTKMIQVSKSVYKKLMEKKHELESNGEKSFSFSYVVEYLLEHQ